MIEVTINNQELQSVLGKIDKYNKKVKNSVGKSIIASSYKIQGEAYKKAPKRTTFLAHSIKVLLRADKLGSKIQVGANYGVFVERGTSAHVINAKNKPFLVFQIGGQWIRKRSVMHPGTKAQPFLRPAAEKEFPQLLTRISNILKNK